MRKRLTALILLAAMVLPGTSVFAARKSTEVFIDSDASFIIVIDTAGNRRTVSCATGDNRDRMCYIEADVYDMAVNMHHWGGSDSGRGMARVTTTVTALSDRGVEVGARGRVGSGSFTNWAWLIN